MLSTIKIKGVKAFFKKHSVLLQESLQYFIDNAEYPDIWDARKEYAIKVLIELKEDYLENLDKESVFYDACVEDTKKELKRLRKLQKLNNRRKP